LVTFDLLNGIHARVIAPNRAIERDLGERLLRPHPGAIALILESKERGLEGIATVRNELPKGKELKLSEWIVFRSAFKLQVKNAGRSIHPVDSLRSLLTFRHPPTSPFRPLQLPFDERIRRSLRCRWVD
jgi:hypothetical protein